MFQICVVIGEVNNTNQELLRKYKREMNLRKKCHNELVRLKGLNLTRLTHGLRECVEDVARVAGRGDTFHTDETPCVQQPFNSLPFPR